MEKKSYSDHDGKIIKIIKYKMLFTYCINNIEDID